MKVLLQIDEQNNITGYATVYPAGMDGVEIEIAGDDATSLFFGESHTLYCLQDGAIVRRPDAETEMDRLRQEQMSQAEAAKAKAERAAAMMNGAPYTIDGTDYQISFTADDGNGMTQVKTAFELGLPDTTIYFSNGTKMPITSAEFGAFAAWFAQKRNEFFV